MYLAIEGDATTSDNAYLLAITEKVWRYTGKVAVLEKHHKINDKCYVKMVVMVVFNYSNDEQ